MSANESSTNAPTWARRWLIAAGVYNLLWGAVVVAFPNAFFHAAGIEPMRYPQVWQCVGMIVGVYGVGYLIAARDPRRHWPIILVGLLGKIFGPIGFAVALTQGIFPFTFGLTILTNDLVWWIPFSMILWDAARSAGALPSGPAPSLAEVARSLTDQHGRSLADLTADRSTLLVCLRHNGCTFCRETLAELSRRRDEIESRNIHIAIATMADDESNAELARKYDLSGASWIADPQRRLYQALELRRGTFLELFGPIVWLRGIQALSKGHGIGIPAGDGFQMPGAFIIRGSKVVRAFRHAHASDRPDYENFVCEVPA